MENNVVVSDYAAMDRILREERKYILGLCKKVCYLLSPLYIYTALVAWYRRCCNCAVPQRCKVGGAACC